jgi:predicted MFS family arabinose efflux permease
LSAAVMAPQGLASIHALFPDHEKSRALGFYGAAIGLAAVIAQAIGGLLISANLFHLHWRIIFLINLPIVAAVFIGGLPLLPDTRSDHPAKLDRGGVVLSALTLGLLIVPMIEGREAGWPWWSWLMLAASPVAAMFFWRYESDLARRGGTPLVNPELVGKPGLITGLASVLLFYVMSAFFLTFSVYLQGALGASAGAAGLMFVPCGVGFFIGPLTTPLAIRAFGRFVPAIGMLCEVLGCVLLCLVVASVPAGHFPARLPMDAALWLIGFGQGWALPTLVRSVIDRGPVGGSGMISGVVNSALQISAALGVAVIGGVFYAMAGVHASPASMAHALIVAMLCVAGCLAVSAALSVRASSARPAGDAIGSRVR